MRHYILLIATALASTLLSACQTMPPSFRAGLDAGNGGRAIVHQPSGFSFPTRVGAFTRGAPVAYDGTGENVSVNYHAGSRIAADVYIYPPASASVEAEFAGPKAVVFSHHPCARILTEGIAKVSPRAATARAASFAYDGTFAFRRQPLHSLLLVSLYHGRVIKYRITFPAKDEPRATPEIATFLRTFPWP